MNPATPLYAGPRFVGSIQPTPCGIVARDRFGRRIGIYKVTREAVAAVYEAHRPRETNYRLGRKLGCSVNKRPLLL